MSLQEPDVIDNLAGVAPGSRIDALRRERAQTRNHAQASYAALFDAGVATALPRAERLASAAYQALLLGDGPASAHYEGLLEATAPELVAAVRDAATATRAEGPYGAYPAGPLTRENVPGAEFAEPGGVLSPRLAAILAHTHFLVLHPRDAAPARLAALQAAGLDEDEIVTLSQLIAFVSFQIRAAHGLRALAASLPSA